MLIHSKCMLIWLINACNIKKTTVVPLHWRHNEPDSVSNHQPHDCLLNWLFRRRSKKTSKLHITGLCVGNSLGTGEFPTQMASKAENVSIWWRHHASLWHYLLYKWDVTYVRQVWQVEDINKTELTKCLCEYLNTGDSQRFFVSIWRLGNHKMSVRIWRRLITLYRKLIILYRRLGFEN